MNTPYADHEQRVCGGATECEHCDEERAAYIKSVMRIRKDGYSSVATESTL